MKIETRTKTLRTLDENDCEVERTTVRVITMTLTEDESQEIYNFLTRHIDRFNPPHNSVCILKDELIKELW